MSYCLMEYRTAPDGHGVSPDCPDGVRFLLLADLPGLQWGIFDAEADDAWSPSDLVGEELAVLIESAMRYPPALALAREEMGQVFGDHFPSREQFAEAYGVALRNHLSRQHESSYVLAPTLKDEAGRLTRGEWYWVLQISGTPPAAYWVSDDYHVHTSEMNDFDLTGEQLKALGYAE